MIMRLFLVVGLVMTSFQASAEPLELSPHVQSGIEQAIKTGQARAVVVGLYDNGNSTIIGFGQRSRDDDAVPDGGTLFEIGSITKVFTALLVQVQVDAQLAGWDDSIADVLTDIEFANAAVAAVSLRELATHTSGMPRLPDNMDPADPLDPYMGYDRDRLLAFLASFDPDELKKEYAYSNLGAGLLGVIASDIAGTSFSAAMTDAVLRPLGMSGSGFGITVDRTGRLATGFSAGADMPNWDGFDALAGAGALVSSVDDLLVFVRRNLETGALAGALDAIRQPQPNERTALGWHLEQADDDDLVYWHNGGTGGYASMLAISPGKGTAVVILTSSTEYNLFTELGFAQLSGAGDVPPADNLDAYVGAYELSADFVISVSTSNGQLVAQATGQGAFPLTPSADDEFVYPAAGIRIVFDLDDTGLASQLTLYQGGQTTRAPRTEQGEPEPPRQVISVDAAQLDDYVGRYQLTPDAVITVLARDGQLFAHLTGQAAYPVFAYEPDKFFYKIVDAQLHFERGKVGVDAVVLHQGGAQRAPRIE